MYLTFICAESRYKQWDMYIKVWSGHPTANPPGIKAHPVRREPYKATPEEVSFIIAEILQLWCVHEPIRDLIHHGSIMRAAILQATAEISAAPRPLPSSDWMKVMSQLGLMSPTTLWNRSLNLEQEVNESAFAMMILNICLVQITCHVGNWHAYFIHKSFYWDHNEQLFRHGATCCIDFNLN